jgi:hypothetical protein
MPSEIEYPIQVALPLYNKNTTQYGVEHKYNTIPTALFLCCNNVPFFSPDWRQACGWLVGCLFRFTIKSSSSFTDPYILIHLKKLVTKKFRNCA